MKLYLADIPCFATWKREAEMCYAFMCKPFHILRQKTWHECRLLPFFLIRILCIELLFSIHLYSDCAFYIKYTWYGCIFNVYIPYTSLFNTKFSTIRGQFSSYNPLCFNHWAFNTRQRRDPLKMNPLSLCVRGIYIISQKKYFACYLLEY